MYLFEKADGSAFYGFPGGVDGHGDDVAKVSFHRFATKSRDMMLWKAQEVGERDGSADFWIKQHYQHSFPAEIRRDVSEDEVKFMQHSLSERVMPLFPTKDGGDEMEGASQAK